MRIKLLVFLLIIFCSCNRKNSEQRSADIFPVWIDLTTPSDSVISNLSSLASDIEYLPLKTTDRVSAFKIVASSDRIYINTGLDLLCFNNEGDFCYKLSSDTTDTEGTFSVIDDFDISSNDSTLLISSYNRLMIFNKTGTGFVFQNSIVLKRPPPSLISLVPDSKNILLSFKPVKGSEPLLSLLINSNGDTLNYRINRYKYKLPLMLSERINHYSDTVFCVKKDLNYFKTRLILDSKGRTYRNWNKRKGIYIESEYSEYYSLERVFEVSDKIFYNTHQIQLK